MKKLDLGQTITVLANVGVIAGIVFLGIELRQNTRIGQAQSRAQIASDATDYMQRRAENPQLEEIMIRANDGEELSRLEQQQLFFLLRSIFRRWENTHYQYRQGLYSEEEFAVAREVICLRMAKGWTQRELAERAHTSQPAIARLESGNYRNVSLSFLRKLGAALGAVPVVHMQPIGEGTPQHV